MSFRNILCVICCAGLADAGNTQEMGKEVYDVYVSRYPLFFDIVHPPITVGNFEIGPLIKIEVSSIDIPIALRDAKVSEADSELCDLFFSPAGFLMQNEIKVFFSYGGQLCLGGSRAPRIPEEEVVIWNSMLAERRDELVLVDQ